MLTNDDTIAAISTAVGPAARIIVRVSGQGVRRIHDVLKGDEIEFAGGSARRARIGVAGITVPAWVYCFAAPRSATGEDVIEFHIPGNPLLARMLLEELMRLGARQAQPGEFTARAYFNGRIDLSEAEGVAAAIAAQSERELAAARQLLAGELARRLRPTMDLIAETLALVEVGIDFSEEEVTFLSGDELRDRILRADEALAGLLRDSTRFERLAHEPHIVLVGRPNAGKSTLLNALAGSQRAIVSAQPGTTRDAIWAQVRLPRGMVRIIDVAGIDQDDPIDQIAKPIDQIASQMQARTRQTMEQADLLVLVRDCTDRRPPPPLTRQPDLRVATKLDLNPDARLLADELGISALCQWNLEELRRRLDTLAFGQSGTDAALALNARHVQAVQQAREALARALPRVADQTAELLALELREALDALGTILGTVGPDELLARIFSRFCIGK